jgi:hypothetical protein
MTVEQRQSQKAMVVSLVLDMVMDPEQRGDDAVKFVEESMSLTERERQLVKAGAILGARSVATTVREMSGRA